MAFHLLSANSNMQAFTRIHRRLSIPILFNLNNNTNAIGLRSISKTTIPISIPLPHRRNNIPFNFIISPLYFSTNCNIPLDKEKERIKAEQRNKRKWLITRRFYLILGSQVFILGGVSSTFLISPWIHSYIFKTDLEFYVYGAALLALYYRSQYRNSFLYLALLTLLSSLLAVNLAYAKGSEKAFLDGIVAMTSGVAVMTGYSFWAASRALEFKYLRPSLFSLFIALCNTALLGILYPIGISSMINNALGVSFLYGYFVYRIHISVINMTTI